METKALGNELYSRCEITLRETLVAREVSRGGRFHGDCNRAIAQRSLESSTPAYLSASRPSSRGNAVRSSTLTYSPRC